MTQRDNQRFKVGQKVNYCGNEATINSAKYNLFSDCWLYGVTYYTINNYGKTNRRGAYGIQEYWLNEAK